MTLSQSSVCRLQAHSVLMREDVVIHTIYTTTFHVSIQFPYWYHPYPLMVSGASNLLMSMLQFLSKLQCPLYIPPHKGRGVSQVVVFITLIGVLLDCGIRTGTLILDLSLMHKVREFTRWIWLWNGE